MKPAKDSAGYLRTVLKRDSDDKLCTVKVHRIIASTFLGNVKGLEVNHKDANKSNNNVDNLEWVTRQENIKHSIENNLQRVLLGEEIGNSILTAKQVIEIRRDFIPRKVTRKMLSEKYGVSATTIKDVILRRSWKHIQ